MKIRLYVPSLLSEGSEVFLSEAQAHYLRSVLRCETGDEIFLFNGVDGEFSGGISVLEKKKAAVGGLRLERKQPDKKDVRLYFAPLKRDCTDLVVEKATELGVSRIRPVITEFTAVSRVNTERLKSIAVEAAEQCRRLDVPDVDAPVALKDLLAAWDDTQPVLIHLDESGKGKPASAVLNPALPAAFLVGPEGGFSGSERMAIARLTNAAGLDLGERILRAETAAIAVLSLYSCFK